MFADPICTGLIRFGGVGFYNARMERAMPSRFLIAVFMMLMLFLPGCTTNSLNLPRAPEGVVPEVPLALAQPMYRIQYGDLLEIKMFLNPEFEQSVVVRPDGMISTMLVQDLPAYGLTPKQLQQNLIEAYKKQLTDPQLTIVVRSFSPEKVYVLGEVNNPGEFVTIGQAPTLLQAIARAGGVKNSAKTRFITILRRGESEVPQAFVADYDEAVSGTRPAADVRLAANDVVFVPRTAVAEAYVSYEQWIKQFLSTTLSVGATYNLNNGN